MYIWIKAVSAFDLITTTDKQELRVFIINKVHNQDINKLFITPVYIEQ